jgi:hypothetical protein
MEKSYESERNRENLIQTNAAEKCMFLSGACLYVTSSHAPCSIEAVSAEAAFGQPDGFDQSFELVETECGQAEAVSDFFHQTLILG